MINSSLKRDKKKILVVFCDGEPPKAVEQFLPYLRAKGQ
jgi:hypothetical protein